MIQYDSMHDLTCFNRECLGTGVHVSMLAPGPTESEFSRAAGNDKSNLFKYGTLPSSTYLRAKLDHKESL